MHAPTPLKRPDQWQEIRERAGRSIVFKHSTTCPISAAARERFTAWMAGLPEGHLPVHEVLVIEERPLARQIAADTGVEHQSPQALLIEDGKVAWHASHWAITADSLTAALGDPTGTPSHSTSLIQAQAEHKAALAALETK